MNETFGNLQGLEELNDYNGTQRDMESYGRRDFGHHYEIQSFNFNTVQSELILIVPYCIWNSLISRHCIQYHEISTAQSIQCWCISSLHRQLISNHVIGYVESTGPCHSRGRISSTRAFSVMKSKLQTGQVTKVWLSCYLVLLSIDSKTR